MAGHTPGNLEVSETYSTHNHPDRFWNTPVLAGGKLFAIAAGATQEESAANAHRLASLNDLLAACNELLLTAELVAESDDGEDDETPAAKSARRRMELARAAIAKAESRP